MDTCQLYTYNKLSINLERNDENYFLAHFDVAELDKDFVHWLNFHRITEKELIEKFWEKQDFHKLTFDDIYTEQHRPKLEEFDEYLFFSIQSALPTDSRTSFLKQEQLSFILGNNYLISFQERSSDHFPEVRERLVEKIGKIRERNADFLLFRMLDAIVDNYFEVIDEISENIRILEFTVVKHSKHETLKEVELQKRKLIELRKIVVPLKDIAVQLEKIKSDFIEEDNKRYFSDLKDNCLSILDDIDSNKQVLEGLTNLYYAAQGQRMNEIMKVLTIVSTIFIPLTFIVGVYGMNFKYMPELQMKNGYFMVWGLMIVIALLLALFFIRKGWLKK